MAHDIFLTSDELQRLAPFFYHTVSQDTLHKMDTVRRDTLKQALRILRETPLSRLQALALTALEEAQMRMIQALAQEGEILLPPGVVVADVRSALSPPESTS